MVTVWPLVLQWSCIGKTTFRCSLKLSPNILEEPPMYSSLQSTLPLLNLYITTPFLVMKSLSLDTSRRPLLGWPPFKVHLNRMVSKDFLETFTKSLNVWDNYVILLFLATSCSLVLLVSLLLPLLFVPRNSSAKWHLVHFKLEAWISQISIIFSQIPVQSELMSLFWIYKLHSF